jgi:predicted nucleotidyltransferase
VKDDVARALHYLARLPGVQRVWLFGSAARGVSLDERSDLDFAVEGLPVTLLCRAWSELDFQLRLPVDLVRWEEISEPLKTQIRREGIILHET